MDTVQVVALFIQGFRSEKVYKRSTNLKDAIIDIFSLIKDQMATFMWKDLALQFLSALQCFSIFSAYCFGFVDQYLTVWFSLSALISTLPVQPHTDTVGDLLVNKVKYLTVGEPNISPISSVETKTDIKWGRIVDVHSSGEQKHDNASACLLDV